MTRLGTILDQATRPSRENTIRDTDRVSLTPAGEAALDAANAALESAAQTGDAGDAQAVRQSYDGPAGGQPKPAWVRGACPQCGGPVVANCYHVGGRGFLIIHECWHGLAETPACSYREVL